MEEYMRFIVCLLILKSTQVKPSNIDYIDTSSTLLAYDCNNPTDITTHSYDEVIGCQQQRPTSEHDNSKESHFQILQENDKVRINGGICVVYKSTKNHFCGTYSHQTSISSLDVTHMKIKIDTKVCKKWHETLIVEPNDLREDTILQRNTPNLNLVHNAENIYRGFKRGSQITTTSNDVNCVGSTSLIDNGSDDPIEVEQVVTHVEYKITIHNVTLLVNQRTGLVIDKTLNRRLECPKQTEKCTFDLDSYVWREPGRKCNLYHVQYASGHTMETTEGKYFVSNETLIYLKIKGEEKRCGRTILATDLDSIYMLRQYVHFHENQTRIKQKLEPEDIIIALDYTSRDAYIYNKLLDNMKAQVSMMNSKHCIDIRTVKNNLFSSFNNLQLSDAIQPLRIDNKGTYALALSEVIYLFKCKEKLVNPVKLTGSSCYKNLPVTIKESNGQVLFLQARNRMLVPLGVQTTCLLNFKAQFKQTNGKYSIYTPEGLVKSSTAYQPLNIHDIQVIGSLERDDVTKPSLYQYDDIIKWNDIISFSTKKSTLLHVLSQDIDIAKANSNSRKNLIDYFKS